jgi:allantoin racemase
MRIALIGTVPGYGKDVRPELHKALPPGTELSAWPSRVGVFPSTPVERDMQAIGHLEAGLRAAAGGADAVVIDSLGDYGLAALRAGLAIPAVGSGERGMAVAAGLGRFAIVTVWPPSMNFVPESLLRLHGLEDRCTGIHNVGDEQVISRLAGPGGYLDDVSRGSPSILWGIVTEIKNAVSNGAEAILLGCTCMSPIAARIAREVSLPVINPLAEAAKYAVTLARDMPPAEAPILSPRAALLTRMVDSIAGEADENCPVCIVGDFAEDDTAGR